MFKGPGQDVNNFADSQKLGGRAPGLPDADPNKGLVRLSACSLRVFRRLIDLPQQHAEQSIEIIKSIPAVSGEGWMLSKKVVGIKDTGRLARSTRVCRFPNQERLQERASSRTSFLSSRLPAERFMSGWSCVSISFLDPT